MFDPKELLARIVALEQRQIQLKDLPMVAVKQDVFTSEPRDPVETFLPKSVTRSLLSDDALTVTIANDSIGQTQLATGYKAYNSGLVTSLPGSPTTGDTCIYTDSLTVPTYRWQLVYLSTDSSATKWQVVGGNPILASSDVSRVRTNVAYGALPTDPLSISTPLLGDWEVTIKADLFTNAGSGIGWYSYAVGATAASDAWAINVFDGTAVTELVSQATNKHTGLAASTIIAEQAKASAGNINAQYRRLWAMPIRVG